MGKDIEKFRLTCGSCQMSKASNKHPLGLLHNFQIPTRPWESVGINFVSPFPKSDGFDYLWVIICRLTNQCHLTPISVQTTTVDLAWYYIQDIVCLHGMPKLIVSDHDPKFTARFWHELHCTIGMKLLMSRSFHPQMDGHLE